ncbi:MAG: sodium/solute symporter, partial [Bacteroidota bacterium]
LGLALVAGFYTASGGLKAVVYTDAIQAIILIVGCSILTYILYGQLDFDWDKVVSSAPEGHFSVVRPLDDEGLPWPGLLMGVPFLGFWYWSTNQYIIQRALGAKGLDHARWGLVFAGFLKIIPLFIMVIPGAMALALYPNIENGDGVFPFLVKNVLPVGVTGLVLAGLISAILSSVDSALNSSSTLIVIDFVKPSRPNLTETDIARTGRITTVILMVVAATWAPQIQHFQGLWDYLQLMFSIVVPPIAIIFLVGVFFKRGNADGAFWTLMLGTGISIFVTVFNPLDIHYTMNVGVMLVISTIIFVAVSLMTPAPDLARVEKYTYRPELIGQGMEEKPWYLDYRTHMVLLVALIIYVLVVFW